MSILNKKTIDPKITLSMLGGSINIHTARSQYKKEIINTITNDFENEFDLRKLKDNDYWTRFLNLEVCVSVKPAMHNHEYLGKFIGSKYIIISKLNYSGSIERLCTAHIELPDKEIFEMLDI